MTEKRLTAERQHEIRYDVQQGYFQALCLEFWNSADKDTFVDWVKARIQ